MQTIEMKKVKIAMTPTGFRELADALESLPGWSIDYLSRDDKMLTVELTRKAP